MEDYTEEFLLHTDKSSIMSILADPSRFAGITGHIVFFKIFDSETDLLPALARVVVRLIIY